MLICWVTRNIEPFGKKKSLHIWISNSFVNQSIDYVALALDRLILDLKRIGSTIEALSTRNGFQFELKLNFHQNYYILFIFIGRFYHGVFLLLFFLFQNKQIKCMLLCLYCDNIDLDRTFITTPVQNDLLFQYVVVSQHTTNLEILSYWW